MLHALRGAKIWLVVLAVTLSTHPVKAQVNHESYAEAEEDFTAYFLAFQEVLKSAEKTLEKVLEEDIEGAYSKSRPPLLFLGKVKQLRTQMETRGWDTPIDYYSVPFTRLSNGAAKVVNGQNTTLRGLEQAGTEGDEVKALEGYYIAKRGIEEMREGTFAIQQSLPLIAEMTVEGKNELRYNVSHLVEEVALLWELIGKYGAELEGYASIEERVEFAISASDYTPFISETVIITGVIKEYPDMGHVFLLKNGSVIAALPVKGGGKFSYRLMVQEEGGYELVAKALVQRKIIASNSLIIQASKMPTEILLTAQDHGWIGEDVTVIGRLQDINGDPVKGAVIVEGKGKLTTDDKAVFAFNVSMAEEGTLRVVVRYKGSKNYLPSNATLDIPFFRIPTVLTLSTNREKVQPGEEIIFNGSLRTSIGEGVPNRDIVFYLNGTPQRIITDPEGEYQISVMFEKAGILESYASYGGDAVYAPSTSGIIRITVEEASILELPPQIKEEKGNIVVYAILALLLILLVIAQRRGKLIKLPTHQRIISFLRILPTKKATSEPSLPPDVTTEETAAAESGVSLMIKEKNGFQELVRRGNYRDAVIAEYNRLLKIVSNSMFIFPYMTPREISRELAGKIGGESPHRITGVFEKARYSQHNIGRKEANSFSRELRSIYERLERWRHGE